MKATILKSISLTVGKRKMLSVAAKAAVSHTSETCFSYHTLILSTLLLRA